MAAELTRPAAPGRRRRGAPDDSELNSYRQASLRLGAPRLTSIAVTSSIGGEGRTTAAVAFARIQAEDYGRRTALLELDFERPDLAHRVGVAPWPGLAEVLRAEISLERALQPAGASLVAISAGAVGGAGPSLATQFMASRVLDELAARVDVIVADLPPLAATSYGRMLASRFAALVLVVRAGATPLSRVREAVAGLEAAPSVVLTGTGTSLPRWIRRVLDV